MNKQHFVDSLSFHIEKISEGDKQIQIEKFSGDTNYKMVNGINIYDEK